MSRVIRIRIKSRIMIKRAVRAECCRSRVISLLMQSECPDKTDESWLILFYCKLVY